MPKTKTAKKALRQSTKRRAVNIQRKSSLKTTLKTYKKLVAEKKLDEAKKELPKVYKSLDKSAKVNLIKKNKASRLKSRLTQLIEKSSKASS